MPPPPYNNHPREVEPDHPEMEEADRIIRLRISGGRTIETFAHTLRKHSDSLFAELLSQTENSQIVECSHRDGRLIRLLVDCLRKDYHHIGDGNENKPFSPPEDFDEWRQLIAEARYWRLQQLEKLIRDASSIANTITVAYHGTLAVGKQVGYFWGFYQNKYKGFWKSRFG